MGKPKDHPLYGWDCEYGFQEENIKQFAASKLLFSNKYFMKCIKIDNSHQKNILKEKGEKGRNLCKQNTHFFGLKMENIENLHDAYCNKFAM